MVADIYLNGLYCQLSSVIQGKQNKYAEPGPFVDVVFCSKLYRVPTKTWHLSTNKGTWYPYNIIETTLGRKHLNLGVDVEVN